MPSVPAFPQQPRKADPACLFVGRRAELQQVAQHAAGQRREGPGIAVVAGGAGMGKTAFLDRVAEGLRGHVVLRAASLSLDRNHPFALVNRLIAAMHARRFAEHVPPSQPDEAPHTAGQRLLTSLTMAAASCPVTVVLDDVQHADVASCLALGFAARRVYHQPVLFVLAVRAPDDGGPHPNVRRIMPARGDVLHVQLAGLSVDEIQELGHALGVAPLRAGDARHVRLHCEGNPRNVIRLLEDLRRDPHARLRRLLPSFSNTIVDQILELPEPSRALLSAMAVLDDRCSLSTVAGVAQVAKPLHALEPLLEVKLVQWWPSEPTTPVRIRTPLQQQAAYRLTGLDERRALHVRAAGVVSPDRALEHRLFAAQGRPDAALAEDLAATAWRWTLQGNLARAAQFALWAADVTPPGECYDQRLLFGVSLLQRDSQYETAAVLRDRARTRPPSALRSCVMGRYAMVDGDFDSARELLESAVTDLERDPSAPDYAVVAAIGYTWLALLYSWIGDMHGARDAAGRCLAVSPFGRRIDRGTEMVYLSMCCGLEGPRAALRLLTGLVRLPAAANEIDPADSMLLILRGWFRLLTGEPAEAVTDIETGLRCARHAGINDATEWGHFWAATAHLVLGSGDRAHEHAITALDVVTAEGRPHVSSMLALTALIEANLGLLTSAVDRTTAAVDLAENFSLSSERVMPAAALAAIARAKGDPLGVVEALRPFAGSTDGWIRAYRWLWSPVYVDALLDLGRIDEAELALATMTDDMTEGYRVLLVPYAYLTGRALECAGEPAQARTAFQRAIDAVPALGNRDWANQAIRGRERVSQGQGMPVVRLTEREHAIAGLIAAGLTNKAVSGHLGITEKTIEAHLTRVYRKLDVKSRGELRAALHGSDRGGSGGVLLAQGARSGNDALPNRYANGRYRDATGSAR